MKYKVSNIEPVFNSYKRHYQEINGGIDGYYEKVILGATIYEVIDREPIACFSVHETRGLTSLVLYPSFLEKYEEVFNYVIDLPLFDNILFTENDSSFLSNVVKHNIDYEVQAYNFEVDILMPSKLEMKESKQEDYEALMKQFGTFIDYNNIDLNMTTTFYYKVENEFISFGALEPLQLNDKRYCISMIVNEAYRGLGYGTETVKFLNNYLQSKKLEVNARCYVLNEVSKKTLLRSGMKISNKLYKVEGLKRDSE